MAASVPEAPANLPETKLEPARKPSVRVSGDNVHCDPSHLIDITYPSETFAQAAEPLSVDDADVESVPDLPHDSHPFGLVTLRRKHRKSKLPMSTSTALARRQPSIPSRWCDSQCEFSSTSTLATQSTHASTTSTARLVFEEPQQSRFWLPTSTFGYGFVVGLGVGLLACIAAHRLCTRQS